jgi:hypothetical protein
MPISWLPSPFLCPLIQILKNTKSLSMLISTSEASGFDPQLPKVRPFPFEDKMGFAVTFSMLCYSLCPGCHSKVYTHFATI